MAMLVFVTSFGFTSCQQEELDTNQFTGELKILAFGPSPVARGGKLHIIGSGMSSVNTVVFPTNVEVTEIEKVSNEEIVVIVPQAAQPGLITVKAGGKEATSATHISYTEPVGFAEEGAITPNPVKPGETLTIKGTYLNLVQQVIFEKGVAVEVSNEDRTKQLDEITVVVPAEAKTGKISLAFAATGDTLLNEIPSKEVVEIVVPSVEKITELMDTKPGDQITLNGKDFDLVVALIGTRGDTLDFTLNDAFTALTFTVPADVCNGIINVATASGVKVPVATIGVALPKEIHMTPDEELRAGDVIAINGKSLELVTSVDFPTSAGVATAEIITKSATEITVAMPEGAVSGSVVLNTAASVSVSSATEAGLEFRTQKPVFKNFANAELSLGSLVTIYGKNFDLVTKVTFTGGAAVEEFVEASATCIKVQMPTGNAETGALTLTMANGETVETGVLTVNLPEFCYVTAWPELVDGELLRAGSVLIVTVDHSDRLTGVLANGSATQFMVNENMLYILTPYNGKAGCVFTLVSDNGSIEYKYDLKPNTEIETVIWTGMHSAGGWAAGMAELAWGGYDWSTVQPGMELKVQFTVDPAKEYGCQIRFGNGSWSALPGTKEFEGADNDGNIAMADDLTEYSFVLTQEMIDEMNANGGLVICGAWFILTKVSIVEHVSLEEVLWRGEAIADGWGNQPVFFEDGGAELLAAGLKVGSILRFYIEPIRADEAWALKLTEGHWGPVFTFFTNDPGCTEEHVLWDLSEHKGACELTVTQEIYDAIVTPGGWGNVFIYNGNNVKGTKITIE